jgi:acyl-CoA synthetase (AMP-forming)/AMP-acid ligase II
LGSPRDDLDLPSLNAETAGPPEAARSAARLLLRLPQGRKGHRRSLARRLVPHRRLGAPRPDGALHFVDRLKNIIRRAGENIAALEVEAALAGHPGVRQVAVIAGPDPVRDEEVMACVVLKDSLKSRETAMSIQDWCLERLSYFKAPGHVAFLDTLPTTAPTRYRKRSSPISRERGRFLRSA